ncbi:glutamate racemase [Candidatus Saccharibacteria bacterium]|nr:glutamate racemase [Candidatus Saccharibacteria bacterium]
MKIGVFDSGIGGTTILNAIKKLLPSEEYFYIADSKNCPYGEKSDTELYEIAKANVDALKKWGAKIIVIACNTATTKCIAKLRQDYPELKFVGTEPAIKLAVATNAKNILVMATPGTIKSERTKALLEENQRPHQNIQLLACPGLANTIELNLPKDNFNAINKKLEELLKNIKKPDVIVLGCTHYSLIKNEILAFFPETILIDGNEGVANRVQKLLH